MQVLTVRDHFFDSKRDIICIKLSETDKQNIANMPNDAFIYCSFPESMSEEEARKYINKLKSGDFIPM